MQNGMDWLDTNTKEEDLLGDWRGEIIIRGIDEAMEARMRIWRVDDPRLGAFGTVRYEGVTASEKPFSGRLLVGIATIWYFEDDGSGAQVGIVERWSPSGSARGGLRFKRWYRMSTSIWHRTTEATKIRP